MTGGERILRVAYDHYIFSDQVQGGISRYFAGIIPELAQLGIAPRIIAPLTVSEPLQHIPREFIWGRAVAYNRPRQMAAKAANRLASWSLTRMYRPHIFHESYFSPVAHAPRGCPTIITCHDMLHDLFPEDFGRGDPTLINKPGALARAAWVICISQSTRNDLLDRYPQLADRSSVIHYGFDQAFLDGEAAPPLHDRPYILFVGALRRRYKNFGGLVDAYARSRLPAAGIDLVCVGGGPFAADELERLRQAGVAERVHQRRSHNDAELRSWYRNAVLFAYPSLYEGFGIPPLESMASNCPVVTMRVSSMPEVSGEAAEYAEPDRPDSLIDALERVALDPARAEALRAAGRERVRLFSWRKCAEATSRVYRMLA